jgi:ABC-2 type transport system ATP-binding protein
MSGAIRVESEDGALLVELEGAADVPAFVRGAAAMPVDLLGVAEVPPTLQEAYLALVGTSDEPGREAAS